MAQSRISLLSRSAILLISAFLLSLANAAPQTEYVSGSFQAAVWAQGGGQNLSPAAQAQCPAGYPNGCSSIQEPDYCCPSNTVCQYSSNHQVGCCPSGQTCSGSIGGSGGYKPTSWYSSYQPAPDTTTYYQQPTSTYYTPEQQTTAVVVAPAGDTAQPTYVKTSVQWNGQYCTTIIANGPNLPTTAGAACGVALVVSPGESVRWALGWVKLLGTVLALQGVGAVVLRMR